MTTTREECIVGECYDGLHGESCTVGNVCSDAARRGDLDELKRLRAARYEWDERTCAVAAAKGHLGVLQWAHENGAPWDESTFVLAVEHGDWHIIQWLYENGCPWNENVSEAAYYNDELFGWLRDRGCPEKRRDRVLEDKIKEKLYGLQWFSNAGQWWERTEYELLVEELEEINSLIEKIDPNTHFN